VYFHLTTRFVQNLKEYRDDVLLREYLKRFECFARAVKVIKHIFAYMVRLRAHIVPFIPIVFVY
jgi:hypothetical protein